MCGICGFTDYKNDYLLGAMAAALRHRGPDEDGFHYDGGRASLASRRLKIIDLDTGRQPVANEDGCVAAVFNGEIYNYKALRSDLEARGHRFRTASDTEVLVHLYEEHGPDLCSSLRGMFAFAIWDSRRGRLLLARDQFGIKPLYYAEAGGSFFFASELKALLLCDRIPRDLDPVAMDAYFTLMRVPAPLTAFRAARKLESGCVLLRGGGRTEIRRYWDMKAQDMSGVPEEELHDRALAALEASVKEQLVSDVPLGLLLSGGLDSAAIASCLGQTGASVTAYSAGFSGADSAYDETGKAALAAAAFGLRHEKLDVSGTADSAGKGVADICVRLATGFDEPFADSSAIPTYLVTRAASGRVKAALTGTGGDELFGGYPRHLGALHLEKYLSLPPALRSAAAAAAALLPEGRGPRNIAGWAKRFSRGGLLDFPRGYHSWCSFLAEEEKTSLYSLDFKAALGGARYAPPLLPQSPDEIMRYELAGYLQDDLLTLADRASMMNSLELRVPFLDVRLASLMAGISLRTKTGGGLEPKRFMRKMLAGRLPPPLLRQKKMGFQAPVARWLAEDLSDFVSDILSPAALRRSGFLDPMAVASMRGEHLAGRRDHSDRLYAAIMFELWLDSVRRLTASPVSAGGRRLHIVIGTDIIQSDDEGGSGRVAWETARRLAARRHKVAVVTRGAPGGKPLEVVDGVEIRRYGVSPLSFRAAAAALKDRYGRPDVLYLHHPYTGMLSQSFFPGAPSAYYFHSPWGEEYSIRGRDMGFGAPRLLLGSLARRTIERRVLGRSLRVMAASGFMAERLKREHGVPPVIVPLGVDTEKFSPAADRDEVRRRLGVPPEKLVVFTVRNLVPRMGLENLVTAAARVLDNIPETHFIIGGRGYLKPRLEAMIKEAGIGGGVTLAGFIPEQDLAAYYQAADLFILPTRELEGFGLVTLEALACGTPVLATPVAANVEVLGGFNRSLLLGGGTPEDIAEGIESFSRRDPRGRGAFREKCREFVENNYSWEKHSLEVEKLFYEML
ncbi:MAG: asparagine synthase (glutamine-hydrolysing) [Elusimicrobia bacterium]|nr:MAG: asparagine synthase (glutamine-hydrolysing) [Elusimicrobiota bacterium]KAF0156992.1 MAG: asparagine synthase (glutamine-hydrolysing) [Elusimicrobiota bacterium]